MSQSPSSPESGSASEAFLDNFSSLTSPSVTAYGRYPRSDSEVSSAESAGPGGINKFKFDSNERRLMCKLPECCLLTHCRDLAVVVCPACTARSYTRYCKREHLFEDLARHWEEECGRNMVDGPIDRETIRPHQFPSRPYVVGRWGNHVERHRQAVYRAIEDGDYFIFADLEVLDASVTVPTFQQWESVRGTGKLVAVVRMEGREQREYFGVLMERVLGGGVAGPTSDDCSVALDMIQRALVRSGQWTEEVLTCLCMQLPGEWGGFRVPEAFYNVAEMNARFALFGEAGLSVV
jgi:hypothetical protein